MLSHLCTPPTLVILCMHSSLCVLFMKTIHILNGREGPQHCLTQQSDSVWDDPLYTVYYLRSRVFLMQFFLVVTHAASQSWREDNGWKYITYLPTITTLNTHTYHIYCNVIVIYTLIQMFIFIPTVTFSIHVHGKPNMYHHYQDPFAVQSGLYFPSCLLCTFLPLAHVLSTQIHLHILHTSMWQGISLWACYGRCYRCLMYS